MPVVDHYGDFAVTDPYRWLEDGSDPKVHQWSLAQDKRTRTYFDKLRARKPMFACLMKQIAGSSSSYYNVRAAGAQLFAMYNQPPKQQPMIAVLGRDADPKHARVILDPNVLNPKGTTAIDWYVPAPDGKHVAVSMSDNGQTLTLRAWTGRGNADATDRHLRADSSMLRRCDPVDHPADKSDSNKPKRKSNCGHNDSLK